jgi:predicted TIM-barrel fold metal-dependent hydrolase
MGFVDADAHGIETGRRTWEYFDPNEREYAPPSEGPWFFEGSIQRFGTFDDLRPDRPPESEAARASLNFGQSFYPPGTRDLSDVPARLRHMDELGADVQVCYSTFWLIDPVQDPVREAAMARSYNRWAAEGTAPSNGRIRWMIKAPGRMMERAMEELEFGAKHGAVGVELTGYKYDISPGSPYWWPLYAKAQDLGLTIGFHIGASAQDYKPFPKDTFYRTLSRVPGAFASLVAWDVPKKFPNLNFSFAEAGSTWVPTVLQSLFRGKSDATLRVFGDWRSLAKEYMEETGNMFVTCYLDDDINYVAQVAGRDCLMMGTDYTHLDIGSDPDGLRMTAGRSEVDRELRVKILDITPRKCHGIPMDLRPADQEALAALV